MSITPNKKLGFGTMRLPLLDPNDPRSVDLPQFRQMIDLYLERGFNYFDTGYGYHGMYSEEAIRQCLVERHPRESFLFADKMPIVRVQGPEDYGRFFQEQLRRCGVSYFDIYLLHNLGKDRYINTERFGGFPFIQNLKERGLVRNIGFSFHDDPETLDRILNDHPEVDVVQLQINYLDWNDTVVQSRKCYDVAVQHGKEVIIMEPVKGGHLAKLPDAARNLFASFYQDESVLPSPASLAVRFAASLKHAKVVLSGMSTLAQVADNTSYMQEFIPLSDSERVLVEKIENILKSEIKVPCTGCRYCMEACPQNIAIPDYINLLNLYLLTGKKANAYYKRCSMLHGKASECLHCGLCEDSCPQHIEIREVLKEVASLFEQQ